MESLYKINIRLKEILAAYLELICWFGEFGFVVHEEINSPVGKKIVKSGS